MLSLEPLYTQQIVDKPNFISWISPSRHATVAEVVVVLLAWVPVTLGSAGGSNQCRPIGSSLFSGATKKMKDLSKSPPKSYAEKKSNYDHHHHHHHHHHQTWICYYASYNRKISRVWSYPSGEVAAVAAVAGPAWNVLLRKIETGQWLEVTGFLVF